MISRILPCGASLTALAITTFGWAAFTRAQEPEAIRPAHVFVAATTLGAEVELLRLEMGRPKARGTGVTVRGAAPPEVYFQALSVLRKADRLAFERTHERIEIPPAPEGTIEPRHVLAAVRQALVQVRLVKEHLNVPEEASTVAHDPDRTPTDVFTALVAVDRQIDLLLDRRVTPGEVYQQVTQAVHDAARVLARFPGVERVPDPPAFERGKRPSDVYRRLLGCLDRLRETAEQAGVSILTLDTTRLQDGEVTPSDVYQLASLLVAELTRLRATLGVTPAPRASFPGQKLPAHVYQRAGILEAQLTSLERLAAEHPDRLRAPDGG